jgi:dihydroorotase
VREQRIWIRGGRVLDPAAERDEPGDVLIEDGVIVAVGAQLDAGDAEVIDAKGAWIAPGFIDLHTHLREPGQEYKEDIASGGRSAVAGGFAAVACMANTHPVNDDPAMTDFIIDRAKQDSPARVYPIAAATRGLEGAEMTEMSALVDAGAVAFSDDGKTIMDGGVMRRILEYSKIVGSPVITHGEDLHLVAGGVVNEGPVSTKLGLPGNPAVAEDVLVARDLMLAEMTGAHLHVAHVSTKGAVAAIRQTRERGAHVTAEVTPHHLTLTDEALLGYNTNAKVAPPLRSAADVIACREGLADGTIDAVASDHAPHSLEEKQVEFDAAPPGMIGLETLLPVTLTHLVHSGVMTLSSALGLLTSGPARALDIPGGTLEVGAKADIVVFDPDAEWTVGADWFRSKSKNSPYVGRTLNGRVRMTISRGRIVFEEGDHDEGRSGDGCGSGNTERDKLPVSV